MTKRKIVLITGSFLIVLALVRLLWIAAFVPPTQPEAIQGRLDLREWNLAGHGAITLDGEWEFYPRRFVMESAGLADNAADRLYASVPQKWSAYLSPQDGSNLGFGSYRLRILIEPDQGRIYSLRLPGISSSSEVFVNGRPITHAGKPASGAREYEPRNVPYTASFATDSNEIDLIVHVANFHDRTSGGIEKSIKFGMQETINSEVDFSVGSQLAVCLLLLLHAVYACILYFFGIRQKALFYFGLVILSAIMTILIDDDKLLLNWLPIDMEWAVKLNHWSFLGVAAFMVLYMKHLLPGYANAKVILWYSRLSAVYAIFVLFAPASTLHLVNLLNVALVLFPFFIVPMMTWRSALRDEPDAVFLFLGAVGLMNNMLWSFGKVMGWIPIGYYPVDTTISFIAFAAFWFKSYMRTSNQTARLADKLRKADKLKDEFLVNTSHELRNPLHGILTIAQTVLDNEKNEPNKENLRLMISVGKRMSLLLNDLLDLSRLNDNRVRLQTTNLSAQSVAAGVLDMCRLMTAGKPIRLRNRIPEQFPSVIADENRLIQIFFNLVHNAMKFTDEGTISVGAAVKNGMAYFHVSDTGIGMDGPTRGLIFQPYEQGASNHAGSASGLGLGLSIVKQLVELHGGALTVDSAPGQGSTFAFSLPLSDLNAQPDVPSFVQPVGPTAPNLSPSASFSLAETAATLPDTGNGDSSPPPNVPERSFDRPSILAVDDDPTNLRILAGALSPEQYDIVTATSGKEALSILSTREWDLVIADVMMPRMSGYELCLTIRERFSAAELPILLLTARARSEDIEVGFQSGASDYVTKPVDMTELKARVRALTGLKRSVHEKLRMEAAWLQAQIQPHFLFNTLNSVVALSDFDSSRMRNLIEAFSHYLRASFSYKNLDRVVPLKNELQLLRSYLYIEKERFEERLEVVWDVNEDAPISVPPLSIQTLAENAVRHGIMSRQSGGKIEIRIQVEERVAEISIIDNGVGIDEEKLRRILEQPTELDAGIGLSNTHRRLMQLYGLGLRIRSKPGQGTTVSFVVPIRA